MYLYINRYIFDKKFIFRIYKELLLLNEKKKS